MSSVDWALQAYSSLSELGIRFLKCLERNLSLYEYVPLKVLSKSLNVKLEKVNKVAESMRKQRLIVFSASPYKGYTLTSAGLDLLAIKMLAERDIIIRVGGVIGMGKESDVYLGVTPRGNYVALKFHRLGRTSFRKTRRLRSYGLVSGGWLKQCISAARREFKALEMLYGKMNVPQPIDREYHVMVMSPISGCMLYRYRGLLTRRHFEEVVEGMKISFCNGVIHSDLSEYNLIVDDDSHILFFDFPQWVPPTHPNADLYLKRDVRNMIKFFRERDVSIPSLEDVLKVIRGA
ncbi:hypothetical protein B6U74_03660 [Candidatus Bathyarchaeota archaeon ex4484_205]|nr:MAG: hypothetical protein B6U74_03660 [Candidatus Bathyarchaeota archaeon ex4484_205]RLG69291.1 MAG: hypothetical protein DRN93_00495 [archaeon]